MLAKHVDPLMHKIIDNSRRLLSVVSPEAAHAVASPLASPPQKKQKAVKTNARIVIAPSPVTVSATPVSKVDGLHLHTHQHTFGTFFATLCNIATE